MKEAFALENSIDIRRSAEDVFDYCSDSLRETEWNPKLKHIEKVSPGPIDVGACYDADFGIGGRMHVEVLRFDRPTAWKTVGESSRLRATFEGRVFPTKNGSRVVLRMVSEPKGVLRALAAPIRRRLQRAQQGHLAAIRRVLEANSSDLTAGTP
jgi:hypothetical protein